MKKIGDDMANENRKKEKELKKLIKKNDLKGIVNIIKENLEDEFFDFDILEEAYGIYGKEFLRLVNEDGFLILEDKNNIRNILFTYKLKNLIMRLDENWEKNFSEIQVKYIKYSLDNPEIDDVFQLMGISDIDATLNKYFDGENILDGLFEDMDFDISVLKKVIENPTFRKKFSALELEFIKRFDKLDKNLEDFFGTKYFCSQAGGAWRKELSEYFDGKKLLPKYYKELITDYLLNEENYIDFDIKKYSKFCNKEELYFIEMFKDNEDLKYFCRNYKIDLNNFNEYFIVENDTLKLKQDAIKFSLENKDYLMLLIVSKEDYKRYELSENQILIVESLKSQKSLKIRNAFLELLKQKDEIQSYNQDELQSFLTLLEILIEKLENSNSKELHQFKGDILIELLNNPDPKRALELIDDVYTKNNLPDVGKAYLIFKILHPNYSKFDLTEYSMLSPVLKNCKNDNERDIIIFADLLKASFGSNNRVIRDYLINIKEGNELFFRVNETNIKDLNVKEINTLKVFLNHLRALYNNTKEGKIKPKISTNNLLLDIEELKNSFKPTDRYDLPDRIVRSFGYFAGFKSYDDAWEYFVKKVEIADKRNRLYSDKLLIENFKIQKGDFIKGIGDLKYFKTILQNGSVCKEMLSIGATSDATPLDTDLTKITDEKETLEFAIQGSRSATFGPIYFILKKKDNISITRDELGNNNPYISDSLEAFSTGERGHYGIRTGFATTEVDYIVIDDNYLDALLPEVKHTIVTNGFYIPVIDSKGKIMFSSLEYDEMKKKMSGVKYYTNDDFVFSDNLSVDDNLNEIKENIDITIIDAKTKKKKINEILSKKLSEVGIEFKDYFDSDISLGNVQLIDTGSTGRGTQTGITSDFDFIMRIDSNMDSEKIKNLIFEAFNVPKEKDIMKNIRLKGIKVDDSLDPIDIDISFVQKSETNFYSTDAALKDRLEQIEKQNKEKYKDVIANIILAKKVLKDAGVYKPSHARENSEGGLGGVGVENWILQHGGSFYDAALSFVEFSNGKKFQEFKNNYKIWDYGLNFYTGAFDEFVSQNMTEEGYEKMRTALEQYLKTVKVFEKESSDNLEYNYIMENGLETHEEENSFKL